MDRMAPGGGGRFAAMVRAGVPPGAAANAGRAKYGAKRMAEFSARGRRRAANRRAGRRS